MKYITEILLVGVLAFTVTRIFEGEELGTNILILVLVIDSLNWTRFKRRLKHEPEKAAKTMVEIMK